nr:right-handed parallel beta-helix repeat-containing protein [uncultured Sphingomonas sp.]
MAGEGITRRATFAGLAGGIISLTPDTSGAAPASTGNVAANILQLKSAALANDTMLWAGVPFRWETSGAPYTSDENQPFVTIVGSDHHPLTIGAWVRQGAQSVTYQRSGANTFRRPLAQKLDEIEVSLADYGVSPTNTAAENLVRFKKAVAACPPGARLRLPPTAPLACQMDTSGGLSAAVVIDKRIHLVIDGDLKATHSVVQNNPPFILNITAEGVTVSGTGRIIGDGTINDTNTGTDETMPGLIRVAADDFTMTGVEIVSPPKTGLLLYQCYRARIVGAKFTGGPTAYSDTSYFAIRANGGGSHVFDGNRFYPDAKGGMFVQCIVLNTTRDCIVTGNTALRPYEKLVYGFGDRNIASHNIVVGNTGFIPGTNIGGTITSVIRFHGNDNKIDGNLTSHCAGGAQCMDGGGNEITNNQFLLCGQTGISAYRANLERTKVSNNRCTYGALPGFVTGDGIRLYANDGPSRFLSVDGNTCIGFSTADPVANVAAWKGNTLFPKVSLIKPIKGNGRYYIIRGSGGRSGSTEPVWPSAPGATVIDGDLTWVAVPYEGGQAEIKVEGAGVGKEIAESMFLNNNTSGGGYGLVTNYVVDSKISLNKCNASLWGLVENNGARNRWEWNDILGTSNLGVQNLAPTSIFLNYEEGDWTPTQGPAIGGSGTFTSRGTYERIGRSVHIRGELERSQVIGIPVAGIITTLPSGMAAAKAATGSMWSSGLGSTGAVMVTPKVGGGLAIFGSRVDDGGGRGSAVIFSLSYRMA